MTSKTLLTLLTGTALAFGVSHAQAQDLNKDEITSIVKQLLADEPELVANALDAHRANMERQRAAAAEEKMKEHEGYFASDEALVMGNPEGSITIVEFFDYNCGYCKRAFDDLQKTIEGNDDIRAVMIEMPILGPTSLVKARWAVAANQQGKYAEVHGELMSSSAQPTDSTMAKIAEKYDLDLEKFKADIETAETQQKIDKNLQIARDIGINGTPAFIVQGKLYRGYLGPGGLDREIAKLGDS